MRRGFVNNRHPNLPFISSDSFSRLRPPRRDEHQPSAPAAPASGRVFRARAWAAPPCAQAKQARHGTFYVKSVNRRSIDRSDLKVRRLRSSSRRTAQRTRRRPGAAAAPLPPRSAHIHLPHSLYTWIFIPSDRSILHTKETGFFSFWLCVVPLFLLLFPCASQSPRHQRPQPHQTPPPPRFMHTHLTRRRGLSGQPTPAPASSPLLLLPVPPPMPPTDATSTGASGSRCTGLCGVWGCVCGGGPRRRRRSESIRGADKIEPPE